MSKVVAFMNPAGSTAKSTTLSSLAHLSAAAGVSTLAIDLDPQSNLTGWLGGARDTAGITQAIRAAVSDDPSQWPGVDPNEVREDCARKIGRTVQRTAYGVDLIAADSGLRALVRAWGDLREDPASVVADLVGYLGQYEVIMLDCKGDLGLPSEAALRAATDVVGVATPTTKALQGLELLQAECDRHGARFRAVVPAQVRPRNRGADADDLYQLMVEVYADRVTAPVRGASNLEAAYTAQAPVTAFESGSAVAEDLGRVYADLVERGVL